MLRGLSDRLLAQNILKQQAQVVRCAKAAGDPKFQLLLRLKTAVAVYSSVRAADKEHLKGGLTWFRLFLQAGG